MPVRQETPRASVPCWSERDRLEMGHKVRPPFRDKNSQCAGQAAITIPFEPRESAVLRPRLLQRFESVVRPQHHVGSKVLRESFKREANHYGRLHARGRMCNLDKQSVGAKMAIQ